MLCQRCWNLKHYNRVLPISIPYEELWKKLEIIKEKSKHNVVVLKMVDLFDFDASMIPNFTELVGPKVHIFLIANKVDLLPKGVSRERVLQWVNRKAKEWNISTEDNFLISSKNSDDVKPILEKIIGLQPRFIYVVGRTNSGKSTFVTRILDIVSHQTKKDFSKPTISKLPGTTLNVISFPIQKKMFLFDTPGVHTPDHPLNILTLKELNMAVPSKKIVPLIYFLPEGKTLFLGGLGRLDVVSGSKMYYTVFVSHRISLHLTNLKKADQIYQKHLGTLLRPPCFDEKDADTHAALTTEPRKKIPDLVSQEFVITGDNWKNAVVDIVYPGLGWISVTGKGTVKVVGWGIPGSKPFIRDTPLMPFETPKPGRDKPRIIKIHKKKKKLPKDEQEGTESDQVDTEDSNSELLLETGKTSDQVQNV